MVTAVATDCPELSVWDRFQEGKASLARVQAWHAAVGAYGKPNIAKGRAARKLDHALSALVCLTPEERQGFLLAARHAVDEIDANRTGNGSSAPQRA